MDILYVIFHEVTAEGVNMLLTSLTSFRAVNKEATICLVMDNLDESACEYLWDRCKPIWNVRMSVADWVGRRMLCKIEKLYDLAHLLERAEGTHLIMADSDVFYGIDPFSAFEKEMAGHLFGVVERTSHLRFPVNGGMVFFSMSVAVTNMIGWWLEQANRITWSTLKDVAIQRKWPDWFFDQDFLCAAYKDRIGLWKLSRVMCNVLPYKYNYFPEVDADPAWEQHMKEAYERKDCVLHFKAEDLKKLIYKPWFKEYVAL